MNFWMAFFIVSAGVSPDDIFMTFSRLLLATFSIISRFTLIYE